MVIRATPVNNALLAQSAHALVQKSASSASPTSRENTPVSQFQGAVFQYGGTQRQQRSAPLRNLPPRPRAPRAPVNNVSVNDNTDNNAEETNSVNSAAQKRLSQPIVSLSSDQDTGERPDSNPKDKQFKRPAASLSLRPGKFSQSADASKQVRAGLSAPLPPMQSFRDVVTHIHGALQSDPSGKSMKVTLNAINAAVLRNEIKLPVLTKVSEARTLLIEIFGKGYQGESALSSSASSVHVMLPLWLINLSKHRTETGKLHAAARLSLPRAAPAA